MFGRAVVVLGLLVLLVVAVGRVTGRSRRATELDPPRQDSALDRHRGAIGWRWAGLGLGVFAAARTASAGSLGLGMMLAPTAFGICVIAGVVVGELATIPRREGVRTAALATRTVGSYLPRGLGGLVAVSTLGLGAVLVTTTRMGSADDAGRAGRSLFRQCTAQMSAGRGPWPGLFYSVPLGIAVIVGLLGAAMALRTIVLRPRTGSAPDLVAADDVLRRRSGEVVVAATGVMVAASLLGVAYTAGTALVGFPCAPVSWTTLGVGLLVGGVLMLVLALWCLSILLSGPRIVPTGSGDTAAADQAAR